MNNNKSGSECQTDAVDDVFFDVYVIWCRVTGKYYVGITRQRVSRRIRQHRRGKQFIDREIQRLGWDGNWDWWVVESNVPANLISECEQKWVAFYDSVYPNGYNKTCGGISYITVSDDTCEKIRQRALERDMSGERNPMYGKHHTAEAKAAIAAKLSGENSPNYGKSPANKGVPWTEEQKAAQSARTTGEKNSFYGRHHTEEAKEKNRQAHLGKPGARKGKKHKPESIAKMRERALERDMSGEKNPFYGKHHTPEAIEKSRQANLGRTPWNKGMKGVTHLTDETRARMSEAHLGQTLTEETRAKISAKKSGENHHMYGKHHSEETRAKMREAHARRRAEKAAKEATAQENAQTTP